MSDSPPSSSPPPLDYFTKASKPKLWDVYACASLSVLFSPAFGAFLFAENWQALGQPKKAFHALLVAWTFLAPALFIKHLFSQP